MSKIQINELTQVVHNETAFLNALNDNFNRIKNAIDDTISRSGVVPNQMEAVLDLNGQRITNVGEAQANTDVLTKNTISSEIARINTAIAQIETLLPQARVALYQYTQDVIVPVLNAKVEEAEEAVEDAEDARDAAVTAKTAAEAAKDGILNDPDFIAVSASLEDIGTVVENLTDITTVADNIANITTVAGLSTAIQAILNNLEAVQNAAANANKSKTWAEGTDQEVAALGGVHSSKGWAEYAQSIVHIDQATETVTGITRYATTAEADAMILNNVALTPAKMPSLLTKAVKSVTKTIAVADWSVQKIAYVTGITGLTSTSSVFVAPVGTLSNVKAYAEANIFASDTGNGSVEFTCETTPEVAIQVNIGFC